ncbi:MAG TPA: hypothetical protein DCX54_08675 [Flavobacteriales bacterium]|nr:hypothetical protein [Flavobacteriales bacterium]
MNNTEKTEIKEVFTDAIRYWEKGRVIYNLTLLSIVIFKFAVNFHKTSFKIVDTLIPLFFYWVIANVLYCSAYVVDIFIQFSHFREIWKRSRVIIFVIGTLFASILAWYTTDSFHSL